ncbi:hypothetical protein PsYK624_085520 [Phanerochaete sordida]|uniref:Uncharacterized protein n=1 Tax=Phanerochaete sordida TaxID=48140 RepID=A0A9P3LFA2_9APHY|nr:hypothetical protein PsYK624_085520 [Phanerochaete sordida]
MAVPLKLEPKAFGDELAHGVVNHVKHLKTQVGKFTDERWKAIIDGAKVTREGLDPRSRGKRSIQASAPPPVVDAPSYSGSDWDYTLASDSGVAS